MQTFSTARLPRLRRSRATTSTRVLSSCDRDPGRCPASEAHTLDGHPPPCGCRNLLTAFWILCASAPGRARPPAGRHQQRELSAPFPRVYRSGNCAGGKKSAEAGLCEMGGTGLEPVTPSLSIAQTLRRRTPALAVTSTKAESEKRITATAGHGRSPVLSRIFPPRSTAGSMTGDGGSQFDEPATGWRSFARRLTIFMTSRRDHADSAVLASNTPRLLGHFSPLRLGRPIALTACASPLLPEALGP